MFGNRFCMQLHLFALGLVFVAFELVAQDVSIGDQVEFSRFGRTVKGTVKEDLGGKKYLIEFANGATKGKIELPVTRFKITAKSTKPANAAKPNKSSESTSTTQSSTSFDEAKLRTWADKSGRFQVKAKLLERVADSVRLETEDGRLITVEISRLSDFDQKYLASAKPSAEKNPFAGGEKMDKSKSGTSSAANDASSASDSKSGNSTTSDSGIPMNTVSPNVTAGRKLLLVSNGEFNLTPDVEVPTNAKVQPVERGPSGFEIPVHDRFGNFLISPNEKVAAVSITNPFDKLGRTAVQFFDLEGGKQLSSVGVPVKDASVVGVIMDPPTFATQKKPWGRTPGRIDFWDGSDGLRHVIGFEGFYNVVKLLNDKQLFTIDNKGQAVVWDWKTAKAEYYFQAHGHAQPAISANGKQIAVAINTGIMIIDLATGKPLGTLATKKRVTTMAFSRDGVKMASIQDGNLAVWDLEKGKLVDEFAVPGVTPFNPSLVWTDDENILMNGSALVNYRLRVPIWTYKLAHGSVKLTGGKGGRFWYSSNKVLIPVKIPQQEVVDVASNYDPEDFLVVKPGMKVAIRMNLPFGQQDQQKIYESLAGKLEANGCTVDPNSHIVLNCFTEKGKTQTREYRDQGFGFGGGSEKATFTPTLSYIQLSKGNDIYWKQSVSSGPGMMMWLGEGESVQQAATKQSKPSPHFFANAKIPKFYARLPNGKKSLGESELTENGLR